MPQTATQQTKIEELETAQENLAAAAELAASREGVQTAQRRHQAAFRAWTEAAAVVSDLRETRMEAGRKV